MVSMLSGWYRVGECRALRNNWSGNRRSVMETGLTDGVKSQLTHLAQILGMREPMVAPPLAGNVLGSPNNSFVIAEWQDAGGPTEPPRFTAPRHLRLAIQR